MELMNKPYVDLVNACVDFARSYILLPDHIDVYFDDCPSERFPSSNNAAESNRNSLIFNKPWFTGQDRWLNHKDDIEFFVFHELRHVFQLNEIIRYCQGEYFSSSIADVSRWKEEFENYLRNENAETQRLNLQQEVEVDANAYALCLLNIYHINDNSPLRLSVPNEAMDIAERRTKEYFANKREFAMIRCTEESVDATLVRREKIGRNDLCPCGSMKKYKKCTCTKYH